MSHNISQYIAQARKFPRRVWFTGSTALLKGQGMCYDLDYYTAVTGEAATDAFEARGAFVQIPSTSNNMAFAGVCAQNYDAVSGGQSIEIYEPGSVCEISTLQPTTYNSTLLTCCALGAVGKFGVAGFKGRGTALALQTKAVATADTDKNIVRYDLVTDGTYTTSTKTLGKTAAFTYAKAGDRVFLMAGSRTAGAALTAFVAGEFKITSVTSANAVVLEEITGGGTLPTIDFAVCAFYCTQGNPLVLAYLFDGDESGLSDWICATNNTVTNPVAMAGGATFIVGGVTLGSGVSVATLADATGAINRKFYKLYGTLTTQGVAVTSAKMYKATGAATATVTLLTDLNFVALQWVHAAWYAEGVFGTPA